MRNSIYAVLVTCILLTLAAFAAETSAIVAAARAGAALPVLGSDRIALRRKLEAERPPARRPEGTLRPHPAFGYTYDPSSEGINRYGFRTPYEFSLCDGRPCLAPDKAGRFVVGIFGDSFADLIGRDHAYLAQLLKQALPGREPVVLNFGVAGYDEENIIAVFRFFRPMLDAAVFLDGVNAAWTPPGDFFGATTAVPGKTGARDLFRNLWNRISSLPLVEHSCLVHWIWYRLNIAPERADANTVKQTGNFPFHAESTDGKQKRLTQDYLTQTPTVWLRDHLILHVLSTEAGTADIHLLQPNPFIEAAKAWTPAEARAINASYNIKNEVRGAYSLFGREISVLSGLGIRAEDLSRIFAAVPQDLWQDSVHPNEPGRILIENRIFQILAGTLRDSGARSQDAGLREKA